MRFIFQLFLSFLVPILVNSTVYSPNSPTICLAETNKGCQEQMKVKNQTLESVKNNFPPLKALMKNYTEQCQNVMVNFSKIKLLRTTVALHFFQKCASGLECFKGKSEKAIFQTSCDEIGIRRYGFDYNCMAPILERVYQEEYNCTKDFGYKMVSFEMTGFEMSRFQNTSQRKLCRNGWKSDKADIFQGKMCWKWLKMSKNSLFSLFLTIFSIFFHEKFHFWPIFSQFSSIFNILLANDRIFAALSIFVARCLTRTTSP